MTQDSGHIRAEPSSLPLQGMRLLSFCHYLQGPAAAQYLADMGADVIKVEPLGGAFERHWSGARTFVDGVSAFYLSANRNKRSLAVDLKKPGARVVLDRLVASADAMLENYRPGVMERLGLGYADVSKVNPHIIYASATGFGAGGPARDRPGQDLLVQARSGLIAATGAERFTGIGCAAVDQHGAALLAMGIAAAYAKKLATGQGSRVEGSLFNAGIDLQAEALTLYYSGHHSRQRFAREAHLVTWFHEAPYGVYTIADATVALSLNPLLRVAEALKDPALAALANLDAYEERDRIAAAVAEALASWRWDDLSARFDEHGVWCERVQDYDDLRQDPQVVHSQRFAEIPVGAGQATVVRHPLKFDGVVPPIRTLPPRPGDQTAEILEQLGFSVSEIDRLRAENVVNNAVTQD
ncbi:CaiB/BaiF CoA transferase family protein [Microvirga makkahensis]|uniref:CoA transferase n=1 Tax=Microvirga makkahensis TaxID=1128670 RepID=A0A7X3MP01_9HYPH|nr:CaiB/BaiF CoA-transferase family protein [Microvirga makkahensis]MXQ10569.1 CoA transferase [Microvirga makkahensis]